MQKSNNKIIVIEGGPSELVAHPEVLSLGHVIEVSPLPNIRDIQVLISKCKCDKCGEKTIRLISYEASDAVGGIMGRCSNCRSLFWIFLSKERLWSGDLGIALGSFKNNTYRKQLRDSKCPKCKSNIKVQFKRPDNEYDFLIVLPVLIVCTNKLCDWRVSIIFWDSPKSYFQLAMKLAEEVIPCSPRAALVFIVSALETYLQKAFMFQSPNNKYLIQKRKVNFQSLQESNDIYKQYMGTDLTQYMNKKEWEILSNSIKRRHGLIHNAGLDKHFEEICVETGEIEPLKKLVVKIVNSINAKLENDGVL